MFKELFGNICPLPAITPEETDQDHFGNKANIIDIDEFKTEDGLLIPNLTIEKYQRIS
jgi:hypothetical protein